MIAAREAFAVARRCTVVGREVTLSGTYVTAPNEGKKEVARKTCSKLSQCYGGIRYVIPVPGCLLGSQSV
jgi:uncharacterized protein (UPF0261 family)